MPDLKYACALGAHYSPGDLTGAIVRALRAAGQKGAALTPRDLAPLDQFHIGGRTATLDLARLAEVRPGETVLDVGGGLGGPARTLTAEAGCRVTVLDLTEAYIGAGALLTRLVGLEGQVSFRHGDATAMPFPSDSFDVAWMQHSGMNVADKARLYAECRRVVRPGGRLALHEIFAGPVQPIHFPVAWAREARLSFLIAPEEGRALLRATGLRELAWQDVTAEAVEWWRGRLAMPAEPGPVGLWLIFGDELERIKLNTARNLEEGRVQVVRAVWEKVGG
jgi:SAM-dependent methyltransferase